MVRTLMSDAALILHYCQTKGKAGMLGASEVKFEGEKEHKSKNK